MCIQQLVTLKSNLYLAKDPFLEGTCDFIWGSQDMVKPPRCLQKLKIGVTNESRDEKAHLPAAKHKLGVIAFFPH